MKQATVRLPSSQSHRQGSSGVLSGWCERGDVHPGASKGELRILHQTGQSLSVIGVWVRTHKVVNSSSALRNQEPLDHRCVLSSPAVDQDPLWLPFGPFRHEDTVGIADGQDVYLESVHYDDQPQVAFLSSHPRSKVPLGPMESRPGANPSTIARDQASRRRVFRKECKPSKGHCLEQNSRGRRMPIGIG